MAHVEETYPDVDAMLSAIDGATRTGASIRLDADRMADALLGTAMPAPFTNCQNLKAEMIEPSQD